MCVYMYMQRGYEYTYIGVLMKLFGSVCMYVYTHTYRLFSMEIPYG